MIGFCFVVDFDQLENLLKSKVVRCVIKYWLSSSSLRESSESVGRVPTEDASVLLSSLQTDLAGESLISDEPEFREVFSALFLLDFMKTGSMKMIDTTRSSIIVCLSRMSERLWILRIIWPAFTTQRL